MGNVFISRCAERKEQYKPIVAFISDFTFTLIIGVGTCFGGTIDSTIRNPLRHNVKKCFRYIFVAIVRKS
jgi:hypothetical protein